MNSIEISFTIGNILLLMAAYPQIKTAWINRKQLIGFSKSGAGLTFLGVIFIWGGYFQMGSISNYLLVFPTVIFWGIVAIATRKVQ